MDGLSRMITKRKRHSVIRGMVLGESEDIEELTHLFFVDNILLSAIKSLGYYEHQMCYASVPRGIQSQDQFD